MEYQEFQRNLDFSAGEARARKHHKNHKYENVKFTVQGALKE
jgi:hypothetical protein